MNFYKDCWVCPYAEYNYELDVWQCKDVSEEGIKCYLDHNYEADGMSYIIPEKYM